MAGITPHRSIYEASNACRKSLEQCLNVAPLMVDEWPRKRLADFNIWASGSGALAKEKASLDQRLATKQNVFGVVINLLSLLESLIRECQRRATAVNVEKPARPIEIDQSAEDVADGSESDEPASLAESLADVEAILSQLVRISIAIRRSGAQARLERADKTFNPGRHDELNEFLCVLIYALCLRDEDKERGNIHLSTKPSPLTDIQERLVEANLRRRHRFLYAQRRWKKQAQDREQPLDITVVSKQAVVQSQLTQAPVSDDPGPSSDRPAQTTAQSPTPELAPTITSTVPTAIEGPIIIPQGSQPSMTAASSTSSKVVYPKAPSNLDGQWLFRCPCCCQTLPVSSSKGIKWRKHLGEDILPYTCVLDDCPQPEQLYRTRKEWADHMQAGHRSSQYWLCFACSEPTKFDEEAHFVLHLQTQHDDAISADQIPFFVDDCVCTVPFALSSCPLCLPDAWAEGDPEALMTHVAEHVHSFSLNSLPWQTPGDKEAEYLGIENIVNVDTEYFAVSSGPSGRERTNSSTSYGRRRDIEEEDMPELSFQDENPEVPWDPWKLDPALSKPPRRLSEGTVEDTNIVPDPTKGDYFRKEPAPALPRPTPHGLVEPSSSTGNWRRDAIALPRPDDDYEMPKTTEKTKPGFLGGVRAWMGRQLNGTSRIEEEVKLHVSKDDYRSFKTAWKEFDPHDTGYVSKTAFSRLLGELTGVFSMSVYIGDVNHSVRAILDKASEPARRYGKPKPGWVVAIPDELNLLKLHAAIASIDVAKVKRRRRDLRLFYNEVMVAADPDRGIHRDLVLIVLSQYRLKELASRFETPKKRNERLRAAVDYINGEIALGCLDTIYWSRQFRRHLDRKRHARMYTIPQFDIPEIIVEDEDSPAPTQGRLPASSPALDFRCPFGDACEPFSRDRSAQSFGETFENLQGLIEHLERQHYPEFKQCVVCNKCFRSHERFGIHIRSIHQVEILPKKWKDEAAAYESIKRFVNLDRLDGLIEAPQDTAQSRDRDSDGYSGVTGRF